MELAILIPAACCGVLSLIHFVTIGVVALHRKAAHAGSPNGTRPEGIVTIIRPVCGLENYLDETLASTFALDWDDYEILFSVAGANDPAVPLIEELIAGHPQVPARLIVGGEPFSGNPKLNNLGEAWRAARGAWIIIADSNVLMPPDCLDRLFSAWDTKSGLVCSPPIGARPQGFWAEVECGFLNTYQARWQRFASLAGFGFAHGKAMAWRRETLNAAGGLRALAAEPAEDAAATKLVRRMGLHVRLIDRPFLQPLGQRRAGQVWQRQARWARLRRATFPSLFALEFLNGSLPALAAAGLAAHAAGLPAGQAVVALAALWYGAEAWLALAAGWHLSRWSPLAWCLRDLLLPALWVAAWSGNRCVWRGNAVSLATGARTG
ncbi:MAG TPA: glycosyltransferase [Xanthobacteraceae bacterium]|nr:glycosyltransferase [Xanthobacteraceae bacterium]